MPIRACQSGNPLRPIKNFAVRAKNKLAGAAVTRCIVNSSKNLARKATNVAKKCFGKNDEDYIEIFDSQVLTEPDSSSSSEAEMDSSSSETEPDSSSSDTELDNLFYDELDLEVIGYTSRRKYSEKSIKDFVSKFLDPYISGKITPENESKDRKPMIELLFEEIEREYFILEEEREEIEQMAIYLYCEIAAKGILLKIKNNQFKSIIGNNEYSRANTLDILFYDAEKILKRSLKEALSKDFPKRSFSDERIDSIIILFFDRLFDNIMKIFKG